MRIQYRVVCVCGNEGSARFYDDDSPYSAYGVWDFYDLNCITNRASKPVDMSLEEAIIESKPCCKICNKEMAPENFQQI
ncbi:hypothetical protein L4D76_19200 [Photobacterium sagamiensis]|uniref:hypothetical protein n=1 Tax=Photobacterium sagamiensis TaxID=2910241 RepID=UPI003D0C893D